MKSEKLKIILAHHMLWLNSNGGERADLRGANLRGADLRGADLDFTSFPLWCGCAHFKCDQKLVYQLLAHICTLDFDDTEGIQELVLPFAIKSHRAKDLGLIGDEKARGEE